jgi:hypothetical protein
MSLCGDDADLSIPFFNAITKYHKTNKQQKIKSKKPKTKKKNKKTNK